MANRTLKTFFFPFFFFNERPFKQHLKITSYITRINKPPINRKKKKKKKKNPNEVRSCTELQTSNSPGQNSDTAGSVRTHLCARQRRWNIYSPHRCPAEHPGCAAVLPRDALPAGCGFTRSAASRARFPSRQIHIWLFHKRTSGRDFPPRRSVAIKGNK